MMTIEDRVFRAWVEVEHPPLPDNIEDMPAYMSSIMETMRMNDPELDRLSDQELQRIINAF
jgi:hypothetical protein